MAVKNSYIDAAGVPVIDHQTCTACLRCVQVCPTKTLVKGNGMAGTEQDRSTVANNVAADSGTAAGPGVREADDRKLRVLVDPGTPFGCIGCLQCGAVCPAGAVTVSGRAIEPGDLVPLPPAESCPTAEQLEALFLTRRSIRRFKSDTVEHEKLNRIIEFAAMAPMGIPPSDVQIGVFATRAQVRELARDNLESTVKAVPQLKLFTSWIGRLMMGRLGHEQFTSFIYPLAGKLAADWEEGRDSLLYDAPAALYIHGTEYAGAMDVGLVLTYAMLAAEAQGLGSCIVGSLHPFLLRNRELREKYGIPASHEHGIVLVLGYPAVEYEYAIRRRMGKVNWRNGKAG